MRVLSLIAIFGWALLNGMLGSAWRAESSTRGRQSQSTIVALEIGKPIAREISGGQSHSYKIVAQAGQYLHVVVEKRGIDVLVTLFAPDGKKVLEQDSPNYAFGPEVVLLITAMAGEYRLDVQPTAEDAVARKYEISLKELRVAREGDEDQILALARVRDALTEGDELYDQGNGNIKAAIERYEWALAVCRRTGDRYWEASTLSRLGVVNASRGDYSKALEYYNQARPILREVADQRVEAATLNRMGVVYSSLGDTQKALECFNQALKIQRAVGDVEGQASTLENIGTVYSYLGDKRKALEYALPALALSRAADNRRTEAKTLNGIGGIYHSIGENQKALEYYSQALAIDRAERDRRGEAATLNNIGVIYESLGERQKALESYNQALPVLRAAGYRAGEAATLNNIGGVYDSLGEKQKALEYYDQALLIHRALGERRGESVTVNNIGRMYDDLGDKQKALELYNQALQLSETTGDRSGQSVALHNIGSVYSSLGDQQRALHYYNQALPIEKAAGDRSGQASTLAGLGYVCYSLGEKQKTLELYNQALPLERAVGDQNGEAQTLANLMLLWIELRKPALAIFYGKQAINSYQQLRSKIQGLHKELQESYLQTVTASYRQLADLLIAQGRLPEAQQVLAMLKEEEYFEFVRRDGNEASSLRGNAALTPEEAAVEKQYSEVADRVTAIGFEYGQLRDKKTRTAEEEQQLAKLESDLTVANQVFQKFLDEIGKEFSSTTAGRDKAFQLRESQGLMETLRDLGSGTVALYTVVGEEKYRVILVTPEVQKAYEYPIKAADLNRKVLEFREAVQNPLLEPRPQAQELYQILIGPDLARDLAQAKAETLMWSLDGVLRYLPIAALHDGNVYLLERYRNVVFTPASESRLKDPVSAKWKALGLGVSKAQPGFAPLPGVPEELRGIIRNENTMQSAGESGPATGGAGVLAGTVMLDEAFTASAMQTALHQHYPLVHIASHFQFHPGNETDSFLLLGDGSHLTLAQIKSLPNIFSGVDLLTLSACDTATGGSGANGREVEGFGMLAQRQGAKAVLATLWPVADESTQMLMREFYRLHEANPQWTKAEALRQAQLSLLKGNNRNDPGATASQRSTERLKDGAASTGGLPFKPDPNAKYGHPYYWAPFILIGNWK